MSAGREARWDELHGTRPPSEVSWYEAVPRRSLDLIEATGTNRDAPVIDVGGGASTLVDHLLASGLTDVTVLDIAGSALAAARSRLAAAADRVHWIAADVTMWQPARRYEVWHDRAVFHFLVDPAERERYLEALRRAVPTGGHVVLATFGPQGPQQCSGMSVQRYSATELEQVLGGAFRLVESRTEDHVTPAGSVQQFLYGRWLVV